MRPTTNAIRAAMTAIGQPMNPVLFAAMIGAVALHTALTIAQTPPPAKPLPCAAAEHRQFDFWIGRWEVRDPSGKIVGHNRIERAHGGCALIENWTGAGGVTGTSINIYDRDHRRWHQTWVDSSGGLLQLDGPRSEAALTLSGSAFDAEAASQVALQRITWTPLAGGRVRQLWESSTDGGKTWSVAFDGLYIRQD